VICPLCAETRVHWHRGPAVILVKQRDHPHRHVYDLCVCGAVRVSEDGDGG
jgi:hypothetical protein